MDNKKIFDQVVSLREQAFKIYQDSPLDKKMNEYIVEILSNSIAFLDYLNELREKECD